MKKLVFISCLFSSLLIFTSGTNQGNAVENKKGIEFFEGTWASALAKARKENKLVFLDAHARWCRPCKIMKKTTFMDASVASFYNKKFINVEMDMERGEGPKLAEKLGLRAYPTLYFIDGNGKVVKIHEGAMGAQDFLQLGKDVQAIK